jgi:hypothetical protein
MSTLQEPTPATQPRQTADALVGTFRSFGALGPVYKIIRSAGESSMHIIVLETGEELDYSLERALNDPEAA